MGGLGGLNREVCGAQLFPIQSGAVFANTLNARSEETSEGELTDGRTDGLVCGKQAHLGSLRRGTALRCSHWLLFS